MATAITLIGNRNDLLLDVDQLRCDDPSQPDDRRGQLTLQFNF